jgi:hypothetical protein
LDEFEEVMMLSNEPALFFGTDKRSLCIAFLKNLFFSGVNMPTAVIYFVQLEGFSPGIHKF